MRPLDRLQNTFPWEALRRAMVLDCGLRETSPQAVSPRSGPPTPSLTQSCAPRPAHLPDRRDLLRAALDSALAVGRGQLGGPRGLGRAPWLPPRWRAARLFHCPPASAASHPLQASWLSQVQRTGLAGDCAHRWRKEVITPAQTLSPSVSPSALLYGLILPVVSAAQGSPGHPA